MNSTCSATRGMIGVAGAPLRATPACAAWMLAGRTASRNTISAIAAMRRVRGTSSPMAPRISQTPVNVTMNSGFGTAGGTMATMSGRMLLKCAAAVKPNITARPTRVDAAQSRREATPNCPITRARSTVATRTMSAARVLSQVVCQFTRVSGGGSSFHRPTSAARCVRLVTTPIRRKSFVATGGQP